MKEMRKGAHSHDWVVACSEERLNSADAQEMCDVATNILHQAQDRVKQIYDSKMRCGSLIGEGCDLFSVDETVELFYDFTLLEKPLSRTEATLRVVPRSMTTYEHAKYVRFARPRALVDAKQYISGSFGYACSAEKHRYSHILMETGVVPVGIIDYITKLFATIGIKVTHYPY